MDKSIIPQGRPDTCRDCAYLEIMSQPVCCRYPPQVTTLQVIEADPMTGKPVGRIQQYSTYPPVALTQWCGEWKRAETNS